MQQCWRTGKIEIFQFIACARHGVRQCKSMQRPSDLSYKPVAGRIHLNPDRRAGTFARCWSNNALQQWGIIERWDAGLRGYSEDKCICPAVLKWQADPI